MSRGAIPALFVVAVLFGFVGGAPMPSGALSQAPAATPTVDDMPPCDDDWLEADVRPANRFDAAVTPVSVVATPGATPTIEADDREMYLVVVTLDPDGCIGYNAPANRKDGAVVWMVQQGKVKYAWQEIVSGSMPGITRGDLAGNRDDISDEPGKAHTLYPGDWVTQDRMVAVSIRNVGSDSAILLKAVYAKSVEFMAGGGGCGGNCR
jgi:hypothetical protein